MVVFIENPLATQHEIKLTLGLFWCQTGKKIIIQLSSERSVAQLRVV